MTKSSKSIYKKGDAFSKLAKARGFRSRSALKLLDVQKKDNFIKPSSRILDLGSSPGGWSQVCLQIVGKKGFIFNLPYGKDESKNFNYFLPQEIKHFAKKFDCEVMTKSGYLPHDFTIFLKK